MGAACCPPKEVGDADELLTETVGSPVASPLAAVDPAELSEYPSGEVRKQGKGSFRVLHAPDHQTGFLQELAGKRLLHVKGFTSGFRELQEKDPDVALEQQQKAVDAMMAFNPDYLVIDGEPFGTGFQQYVKAYFDERGAFMDPPELIWVTRLADQQVEQVEGWAEEGFTVTVCLLPEENISASLSALCGHGAAEKLKPLGGDSRGSIKLLEGSPELPWVKGMSAVYKELVARVETRGALQYFSKSTMEAAAKGSAAFHILRGVEADGLAVLSCGGGESLILEYGAIYLNSESGFDDDNVALFPFVRASVDVADDPAFRIHVGQNFEVEDMGEWIRQISGQAPQEQDGAKAAAQDFRTPAPEAPAALPKKLGMLGTIVEHWQNAVVFAVASGGAGRAAASLAKSPLLDGAEKLVEVMDSISKGMGDYLKNDLQKIRKSKAPALQDSDDFKQWLLGEMPVHASTKYKSYVDDSAFMGQLWMGRQVEFWAELIAEYRTGKDIKTGADAAYKRSLKKHHGFLQVTAFTAALKKLPEREAMTKLLQGEAEVADFEKELEAFVELGRAIGAYQDALDKEIDGLRAIEAKNFGKK